MNKTHDIEDAIRFTLPDEPVTVAEAEELLYRGYPVLRGEDRRWIGIAMHNLERTGRSATRAAITPTTRVTAR